MQTFAIIPAAGTSQRMGQPKLLLPWRGRTIIEHVLDSWRGSQVSVAVMVVHPDDRQLAELARRLGATVVVPDAPPDEMKDSVRIALAHVERHFCPQRGDAWLLAPADMPRLATSTIDRLIAAYRASLETGDAPLAIWVPAARGRRGHPALFPWPLAAEVERLAADEGTSALLARFPVRTVDVDAASIDEDLDTPDDYRRLGGS